MGVLDGGQIPCYTKTLKTCIFYAREELIVDMGNFTLGKNSCHVKIEKA